mmetsp:Transcript_4786/g.12367  ORF Transcript_4786/g.12367 Transcript_4786/m.12367 type:complete len:195 (+) Transcript_4786:85-669(+)
MSSCVSRYAENRDDRFADQPATTRTAEQEYIYRLSLEAAEALAAAATMRNGERSMTVEDRLSLEAAEVLTDVAHMRRRSDLNEIPPPPPKIGHSPPTPEQRSRATSFGSPGYQQHRGKYRCGRCGQMKVNHVCPLGRLPLQRSLAVQTEPIRDAAAVDEIPIHPVPTIVEPQDRLITVRRWDPRKRSLSGDLSP